MIDKIEIGDTFTVRKEPVKWWMYLFPWMWKKIKYLKKKEVFKVKNVINSTELEIE